MPSSQKTIAIIGGTGVLGGSIARYFSSQLGFNVRTISRQPESSAAIALQRDIPAAQILSGSLDDRASLYQLFLPATVIFVGTFYWKIRSEALVAAKARERGVDIGQVAMEHEVQQYRNVFDTIAQVICERALSGGPPVGRIVVSTLPNPREISGGLYKHAFHFESRAKVRCAFLVLQPRSYAYDARTQGADILCARAAAGLPGYSEALACTSYIYTGLYLQAFFNHKLLSPDGQIIFGPNKQRDGAFLFKQVDYAPHRPLPFLVDPSADFGRLVGALVRDTPPGTHLLAGLPYTLEEMVTCWGETLGVTVRWESVSIDEVLRVAQGDHVDFLRGPLESSAFVTEYGFDGGTGAKWPADVGVESGKLKDLSEEIGRSDWSFWLNGLAKG